MWVTLHYMFLNINFRVIFSTLSLIILKTIFFRCSIFLSEAKYLKKEIKFSNPYIFVIQSRWSYLFQTMSSVRSDYLSLKYQRFAS